MTEDTPYLFAVRGIVLLVPRTIYKKEHIETDVLFFHQATSHLYFSTL